MSYWSFDPVKWCERQYMREFGVRLGDMLLDGWSLRWSGVEGEALLQRSDAGVVRQERRCFSKSDWLLCDLVGWLDECAVLRPDGLQDLIKTVWIREEE